MHCAFLNTRSQTYLHLQETVHVHGNPSHLCVRTTGSVLHNSCRCWTSKGQRSHYLRHMQLKQTLLRPEAVTHRPGCRQQDQRIPITHFLTWNPVTWISYFECFTPAQHLLTNLINGYGTKRLIL